MPEDNDNGWDRWKNSVIPAIERLERSQERLNDRLDATATRIDVSIKSADMRLDKLGDEVTKLKATLAVLAAVITFGVPIVNQLVSWALKISHGVQWP